MPIIAPVHDAERISIMDALRGIAILGIFIANIGVGFAMYDYSPSNSGPYFHPWDKTFLFWEHVFIEGKFYSIFSLLFGWGMAIQLKRTEMKGLLPVSFMRRRLTFMFLLGFGHLLLIWWGDIVAFYALVGFIFLWIRKWSDKKLLITAIILLLSPILLYYLKMKFNWLATPSWILYDAGGKIDYKLSGITSFESFLEKVKYGNYFDLLKNLLSGFFYRFADLFFQSRISKVLGMFILGYLLGRNERYKQVVTNTKLLWTISISGLLVGLPSNYYLARYMETGGYYQLTMDGLYRTIVYASGVAPLALSYVSLFFLLEKTNTGKKIVAVLQPAGKMAFSNYILHSIIGSIVFFGVGFGLTREVGPVNYTLFAILVFPGQVLVSTLWLKYFNYGPVEWLWRSATYKKWQPMRKEKLS